MRNPCPNRTDTRVHDAPREHDLALEALEDFVVLGEEVVQHFERHRLMQARIGREEHDARSSLAELLIEDEPSELAAGLEGHLRVDARITPASCPRGTHFSSAHLSETPRGA